jgi:hypothetical protein
MIGITDSNVKIVTNGLIVNWDAAQPRSYNGSGSTWFDISGQGNDGTLVDSPTYTSANGGSFIFNDFQEQTITSNLNYGGYVGTSQMIWYKWNGTDQLNILTYIGFAGGTGLGIVIFDGDSSFPDVGNQIGVIYGGITYNALSTTATLTSGVWTHLALMADPESVFLYKDGVFVGSTGSVPNDDTSLNFGYQFAGGDVGIINAYNRALFDEEVGQNYDAIKSRYGL